MINNDDYEKIVNAYFKKELDRRDFLRGLVAGGGIYLFSEVTKDVTKIVARWVIEQAQGSPHPELVKQLFGDFQQNTKFTPGSLHYLFPAQIPPDDKAAMADIDQLCGTVTAQLEIMEGFFPSIDFASNFVCTGSPMSNLVARLIMQYEECVYQSGRGLIRERDPVLDLRYEYIFDPRYFSRSAAHRERVGRGQVLNWSVRDTADGEIFWPQVNRNTFLSTDYLLVTVAPNILDRESFERGERIIIFGGTHGPGTRAVKNLLRDEVILKHLVEQVRGIKCWQALLQVDQIFHENEVDVPFSLSKSIHCCPINLNDIALRKWLEQLPTQRAGQTGRGF